MAGGTGCGLAMVLSFGDRDGRLMQVRVLVAENCTWQSADLPLSREQGQAFSYWAETKETLPKDAPSHMTPPYTIVLDKRPEK